MVNIWFSCHVKSMLKNLDELSMNCMLMNCCESIWILKNPHAPWSTTGSSLKQRNRRGCRQVTADTRNVSECLMPSKETSFQIQRSVKNMVQTCENNFVSNLAATSFQPSWSPSRFFLPSGHPKPAAAQWAGSSAWPKILGPQNIGRLIIIFPFARLIYG